MDGVPVALFTRSVLAVRWIVACRRDRLPEVSAARNKFSLTERA